MSDDLISRKELLTELNNLRIELTGISCRKEFQKTQKEIMNSVIHIVYEQPTAVTIPDKLPEYDPIIYTDGDGNVSKRVEKNLKNIGWNDCLDEILGGNNKE